MQHDREILSCRKCGTQFDLARQNYYDNLCPSCKEEQDPKSTWERCHKCGEKVDPDNLTSVKVRGAARDPSVVYMPAHESCAEDHLPPGHVEP